MALLQTSEYRIGEALLSRVMKDQLAEVSSPEDVLTNSENLKNENEEKMVLQLCLIVRRIGDFVQKDKEIIKILDGLKEQVINKTSYWKVVEKVFDDGRITWGRIVVLFCLAGELAVKVVTAHLPLCVKDILTWTLEYFKNKLLSWVQENGGWINSFSELACAQVNRKDSMGRTSGTLWFFIGGFLLGGVFSWKLFRRT